MKNNMFCKHCGTSIDETSKFCIKCGGSISGTNTSAKVKTLQPKEFNFARTWVRYSVILTILLTIFFGLIGEYENDFSDTFIGVLILSAILAIVVTFIIKWRKSGFKLETGTSSQLSAEELEKYKGIGGWLIIVGIGLFINTIMLVIGISESISLFTNGAVDYLSNPTSDVYIPGYSGILKFELILDVLFIFASAYLIYLFFKKSTRFPKYYIYFLVASAVYLLIDYLVFSSFSFPAEVQATMNEIMSEQTTEMARAFISAVIWSSYMLKSKRVKATFVEEIK